MKSDGTPSPLYHQFRNPGTSKKAAAEALKIGYSSLFERNEYIHKASEEDLKGTIVELTGLGADNPIVKLITSTFKHFKAFCDFDGKKAATAGEPPADDKGQQSRENGLKPDGRGSGESKPLGLNLAYSINLYLPASDDVKVFDAIFKSLKENLLKE